MGTWAVVGIALGALILGAVAGFFISQRMTKRYFEKNPPISEAAIRAMYAQMGRKPSEKQVRQTVNAMKNAK